MIVRRPARGPAAVVAAAFVTVLAATGCGGAADVASPPPEPAGCTVLPESSVADLLDAREVDAQDATTPLKGRDPIVGCRWEALSGNALTVTLASTVGTGPPEEDVATWRQACTNPGDVELGGAVAATCGDDAFGVSGSELFARYDDGSMTMRIGLGRAAAVEPGDADLLADVARRLVRAVPRGEYDRLVERS